MSSFNASTDRDANRQIFTGDYPFRTKKTITFAGATTNAWGDDGGVLDGAALFTVTGVVQVKFLGVCIVDLDGGVGVTVEVGISGATAIFVPQIVNTEINTGNIVLNDATPGDYFVSGEEGALTDNLPEFLLNGQDIILTVANGGNVTSGVIDWYCLWKPISDDGNIIASSL